jgi:hypothetical protein
VPTAPQVAATPSSNTQTPDRAPDVTSANPPFDPRESQSIGNATRRPEEPLHLAAIIIFSLVIIIFSGVGITIAHRLGAHGQPIGHDHPRRSAAEDARHPGRDSAGGRQQGCGRGILQ